jgi:SAM-dependent methyltransferase
MAGGAQAVPLPAASFELAWMLKSLHHVPLPLMAQALAETHRLLVPGGHLYVSEPVYDGTLNEVVRLFNDEGLVRAAAQAALDTALASGAWQQVAELRFQQAARYGSLDEFEQRMLFPTFADHGIDAAKQAAVRAALAPHAAADGRLLFMRPMHVRLLRRLG